MRRVLSVWVLATGLVACRDEPGLDEGALSQINEGDPCNWYGASCLSSEDMLRCVDGRWTAQACDDYCASLGMDVASSGCDVELGEATPEQLCTCAPGLDGCYPGQGRCDEQLTLQWCADDWSWATSSCAEVCSAESMLSLGCTALGDAAACLCTGVGTPCSAAPSSCTSDSSVAVCEGGLWTEQDCAAVCGQQAYCDPSAAGGAVCDC